MPRSLDSLVLSAKSGDHGAMGDLVRQFQPLIRRVLRTYRELSFSEDLPGEAYLIVSSLVQQFDPDRGIPFPHYLDRMLPAKIYTYVRRECRTNRREVSMVLFDEDESASGSYLGSSLTGAHNVDGAPHDDVFDQVMFHEVIRRVLTSLTPLQADVFSMRVLGGEDFRHIAREIGSTPGAVRFVYYSARQRLKKRCGDLLNYIH